MSGARPLDGDLNRHKGLLKTGIIGTVIVALCCFTPVLVILLGAVGLSAVLGWLDYVIFPALGLFIAITIYALWKRRNLQARSS
ncbi:mercury resistance system transport protein MerF [Roseovarius spongiae]|uniref:Mercury resistance system transport protein MerF n=1 Tax=Roseovarius spongiae TaxID=2320272 RepID=A0A3A8BA17_9RHOB|nr:mercury resistance system transport protein MerF [Roseovarius spongiae]RKF15325.1 mercury resistance system transport protein MerF [Roseovarius spongiae]